MTNRLPAALLGMLALLSEARADSRDVQFPQSFEQGVHYATVERGSLREELYTSRAAVDAAKRGTPFPDGTVITLVDYREGRLHRYVVMEKRPGAGAEYPADIRNGDWKYQEFAPDKSVNRSEDGTRCMRCHKSQARQDFVFTVERMKSAK